MSETECPYCHMSLEIYNVRQEEMSKIHGFAMKMRVYACGTSQNMSNDRIFHSQSKACEEIERLRGPAYKVSG